MRRTSRRAVLLASCLCAVAAVANGATPRPRPLAVNVEGSALIFGAALDDFAGESVAGAGDVNGDKLGDVIVGMGHGGASRAYVVFGVASGPPTSGFGTPGRPRIDLAKLGRGGFRIIGGQDLGSFDSQSVAAAGDLNGDGLADVVIGTPFAGSKGEETGGAYVVFGSKSSAAVDLANIGARGFRIDGPAAGALAGTTVAGLGDINGDGHDDIAISTPNLVDHQAAGTHSSGTVYVVFGSRTPANVDLADLGARGFRIQTVEGFPTAVAGAGDVNGDGRDDIIVGADGTDYDQRTTLTAGSASVVFGSSAPTDVDLAALGSRGFQIVGPGIPSGVGYSVAGAGDVNGDHLDDVIVGGPNGSPTRSGSAYVVYGSAAPANVNLASIGTSGYRIYGVHGSLGASVAGAGDVNGDHLDDVVIGAPEATAEGIPRVGSAYLVYGAKKRADVNVHGLGPWGLQIDGNWEIGNNGSQVEINRFGVSVSSAGDFNGDGRSDLIMGAPGTRGAWGAAWLVSVRKPPPPPPKRRQRVHIVGSPLVGQTLRCNPGTWPAGTRLSHYGWIRDSQRDWKGANPRDLLRFAGQTHLVASADRGHVFACLVLASGPGGQTVGRSTAVRVR